MNIFFQSTPSPSPSERVQSLIAEIDEASLLPDIDFHNLIAKAKECSRCCKEQITQTLRQELKSRVDALRFQGNIVKEEKNSELRSSRLRILQKKLIEWQQKNLWFSSNKDSLDTKILETLEHYPHLVKRLIGSDTLLNRFAEFALVYQCGEADSVEIFAHYASVAAKIDLAGLVPAIGQYKGLEIQNKKVLLKRNGSLIDIQNQELFSILKRMEKENHKDTDRYCPFFYGPRGIIEFNRYLNGSEIDLENKDYYQALPGTGIFLSYAEMKQNLPNLEEGQWAFVMKAGRHDNALSPSETHSWIEIYKPIQENNYELLMSVGLWQKTVPETKLGYFKIVMGSIPATIAVFENRIFDRMQQVRAEWFSLSEEEGLNALENKIRTRLIDAREGFVPFQVCAHNCLQFAADLTRDVVGEERFNRQIPKEHLSVPLFEIDADPTVRAIFSFLQRLPSFLFTPLYWLLRTLAGQYSPFTVRNRDGTLRNITVANDSEFGKTNKVPLPAHFAALKQT